MQANSISKKSGIMGHATGELYVPKSQMGGGGGVGVMTIKYSKSESFSVWLYSAKTRGLSCSKPLVGRICRSPGPLYIGEGGGNLEWIQIMVHNLVWITNIQKLVHNKIRQKS